MGRRGRSQKFLTHWHQRELELADVGVLNWTMIDDPAHPEPHAECFRLTSSHGTSRILHPTETLELLVEPHHADAEHVPVETHAGIPFTH